ncbi:unnamed protein product, partial [marine sediment metagenome]
MTNMKNKIIMLITVFILFASFASALTLPSFINSTNLETRITLNNTINDSSGNNYLTQYFNASGNPCNSTITGQCGNYESGATSLTNASISLNGIDEYIAINDSILNGNQDFSISLWMNTTNLSTNQMAFGTTNTNRVYIGFNSDGTLKIAKGTNTSVAPISVSNNIWYHVVLTYDNSTENVSVYLNGILQVSTTETTHTDITTISIGSFDEGASNFFSGTVDELNVLNNTLNSSQVYESYISYKRLVSSNLSNYVSTLNDDFDVNVSFFYIEGAVTCGVYDNHSAISCGNNTPVNNETTVNCTIPSTEIIIEPVIFTPYCYNSSNSYNGTSQNIYIENAG